MASNDACTGAAGAVERIVESSAKNGHQISGMDILNGLWGSGVSKAEGLANIRKFNECNKQKTEENPHVPKVRIDPPVD